MEMIFEFEEKIHVQKDVHQIMTPHQSSEWAGLDPAQPGPARPSPTHGPNFFRKRNHGLGWAEFFGEQKPRVGPGWAGPNLN
jgi:hypothetical protein